MGAGRPYGVNEPLGGRVSATEARKLALEAIYRARRNDAWLSDVLSTALDKSELEPRDRAFAARIARGVSEHVGTLDEIIDSVADRPGRIEPQVRDVLRLAAYEAIFLDTPDRAVVSEGVDLVRSVTPRAAGYANAVLRKLVERATGFPYGDPETDLAALARQTGHPLWLAERLVKELGTEAARTMMLAGAEPAPFTCAFNPFRATRDEAFAALEVDEAQPEDGLLGSSIVCGNPSAAVKSQAVRRGMVIVCDEAAQAVCSAAPVVPGGVLVDVAAGRGTKTALLQAAALAADAPMVVTALDVYGFKTELLHKRMTDLKVPGVVSVTADATDAEALTALGIQADLVFVDAPCSGLGTLRRHPEKRWAITPSMITEVAALGASILGASANLVGPDGFMVYSTCTVTEEENASVVRAFIEESAGSFKVISFSGRVPESFERWVTSEGWLQTIPEPGGPDGHFAALVQRAR